MIWKPSQVIVDARFEALLGQSATILQIKNDYALKSSLNDKADKSQLVNYQPKGEYVEKSKLADYSTTVELRGIFQPKGEYLTQANLAPYLKTETANTNYQPKGEYATKEDVTQVRKNTDIVYLKKEDAETKYAKRSEVPTNQSFADKVDRSELSVYLKTVDADTKYQPKGEYATKKNLEEYVKSTELSNYQQAGDYANKRDLADYLLKTTAATTYQPVGDYALKSDLTSYAKSEVLTAYQLKGDYSTNANVTVAKTAAINAAKDYTDTKFKSIMGEGVDAAYDTLREIQDILKNDANLREQLTNLLHKKPGKFVDTIGDGVNSTVTVTHNLRTTDIMVNLWDVATSEIVFADIKIVNDNSIQVKFDATDIPAMKAYKIVVVG